MNISIRRCILYCAVTMLAIAVFSAATVHAIPTENHVRESVEAVGATPQARTISIQIASFAPGKELRVALAPGEYDCQLLVMDPRTQTAEVWRAHIVVAE